MGFGDATRIQAADGFTPDAFTWNNAMLEVTDGSADKWFQELNPTPIENLLTPAELGDPDDKEQFTLFAPHYFGANSKNGLPGLEVNFETLGEQKPIASTLIGEKLLRILAKLNISWSYNERRAVSHDLSVAWSQKDEGVAQFPNYFGLPVPQRFRVFVNSSGQETLVWSAELLVATREYLHEIERFEYSEGVATPFIQPEKYLQDGGMSFGRWSERIHLPLFFKRLFYLGETPFPSTTILTMPRTIAFKDVPSENMPRPFIYFERHGMAIGPFEKVSGGVNWAWSLFPTVVHGGWLLTNEDETELESALIVASNGINRISTIIEDGYHNYQRGDYPAPYDDVLQSAAVFDQFFENGQSANGHSKWIPGSRIGFLIKDTENRFMSAARKGTGSDVGSELQALAADGVGKFVASATNNLAWYFFMPEISKSPQNLPEYERILTQAARLKVKDDSVNCLSNLGILNYMAYKTDRAIELFKQVLENSDDYSDNEAYFYLAHIYDQLGENTTADEYRKLYAQVEPYGWPIQEQIPLGLAVDGPSRAPVRETGNPSPGVAIGASKFCGACGAPQASDSEKFCGMCGKPRL